MTPNSIMARLGPQAMVIDPHHGRGLLTMAWPDQPVAAARQITAGLRIEPGERYAVMRGVAVMPIRGMLTPDSEVLERWMGWTTFAGIEAAAAELAASEDVAAVVLEINSPGGLVIGLDGAVAALAALRAAKPVYAFVSPLAASGAYWLAVQAATVAVAPGAWVGSIGAMQTASAPVQPGEDGEQYFEFRSAFARGKNPDPSSEAGAALIQTFVDKIESQFHAAVAAGRGIDPAELAARLSATEDAQDGGGVYLPEDALARGLIDSVETRAAFYDRIFSAHGLTPRPTQRARAHLSGQSAQAQARAALALAQS